MASRTGIVDTSPEALSVQVERFRGMSPAEKAARVTDLTRTACTFALAGLRARHPHATHRELLLRLAALRLGADVVHDVYRWRAPDGA
jgi:hypothetical protein